MVSADKSKNIQENSSPHLFVDDPVFFTTFYDPNSTVEESMGLNSNEPRPSMCK